VSRPTAILVWLVLTIALAGCGSSSSSSNRAATPASNSGLVGGLILNPPEHAPALVLHDYTGPTVSLASMRGDAVFVTFVYTHCPNVCPLIVSSLAAAQRSLGRVVSDVRFVAVTVDPRDDTPHAVRTFLAARGALGRMDYLLGSRSVMEPIWKAWHVTVTLDHKQITHSSVVYGITATGRIAIVYPDNFSPQQIVHDVPLLERS
jgi:protein SCO1